eukprot:TRINITY_DN4746_c0_g1_i1.p1 TRINITY_DN4746_c0_g1~~TRINITY_DN4746_c0_g1_i1.p1  ORF type:complete len:221 (-),score=25.91 TRINITY_DN4746_c0_g1_i1:114-776(-)
MRGTKYKDDRDDHKNEKIPIDPHIFYFIMYILLFVFATIGCTYSIITKKEHCHKLWMWLSSISGLIMIYSISRIIDLAILTFRIKKAKKLKIWESGETRGKCCIVRIFFKVFHVMMVIAIIVDLSIGTYLIFGTDSECKEEEFYIVNKRLIAVAWVVTGLSLLSSLVYCIFTLCLLCRKKKKVNEKYKFFEEDDIEVDGEIVSDQSANVSSDVEEEGLVN